MKINDLNKLIRTDEEVDNQLMDAIIVTGCHELIKSENFEPTEEELNKAVSKDFDDEMENFFQRFNDEGQFQKRQKRVNKFKDVMLKISACFAILVLILIITVVSSEAAQVVFMNTYVKVFDIKTDFSIISEDEQINVDNEIKLFGYIPSGFELTETFDNDDLYMATFENSDGEFITIKIMEESAVTIDSEETDVVERNIGGNDCYISDKDGTVNVFFIKNERGYIIESNTDMHEIKKIIENIK